jgi:hypothetical protein
MDIISIIHSLKTNSKWKKFMYLSEASSRAPGQGENVPRENMQKWVIVDGSPGTQKATW